MDGNNHHHSYLQDEVNYDDLINNAGWPGSADLYTYPQPQPQPHPAQDGYPRYQSTQSPFDQYDLSQQPTAPTYVPSFSNTPYASQYQHARPPDVFGSLSYSVDPTMQSYHRPESSFSFNPQENAGTTISPHSLQYNTSSNQSLSHASPNIMFQQSINNYNQRPQEQPALFNNAPSRSMLTSGNSLQYQTLPNGLPGHDVSLNARRNFDVVIPTADSPCPFPTKTESDQDSLRITHHELLERKKKSSLPELQYAPFVVWDDTPIQVAPGLKS